MSLVLHFDTSKNFWTEFPAFKETNPFKELHESDKSKKKIDSSMIMWFVALCYDPRSMYVKLGPDEKHVLIATDFMDDPDFYSKNKDIVEMLISAYCNLCLTPMERHLMTWEQLLNKRTRFLKDQEYTKDSYDFLDKMAVGTAKVYAELKKIKEDLMKEDNEGDAKGGSMPSLND